MPQENTPERKTNQPNDYLEALTPTQGRRLNVLLAVLAVLISQPVAFLWAAGQPQQLDGGIDATLNVETIAAISEGVIKVFLRVEITYLDISGGVQVFPFCLVYRPDLKDFRDCRESEYAPDDDKPS